MSYNDDWIVAISYKNKGVRILKGIAFKNRSIHDVKKNIHTRYKMCSHILFLLKL
ncbi:hypothetical protein A45J_2322 [hot springs metagenome]|uniref:Uncharacterized protein n=1 Tax=hot springs metagenome TaxID=433727 RepID=A0A5J4KY77_9ZZZZ